MFSSLLLVSALFHIAQSTYTLVQDYSGDAFFQGFEFFADPDPTDGHVQFQTLQEANSTGLAGFMQGGDATNAIYMGVDSSKVAPNGRGAIRVGSIQTFQHALVVADIVHMPGGICGTWPAFWMIGANWPDNGEIDIVEGVNDQATNQMTLHSTAGPVLSNKVDFSGKMTTANCDISAPGQPTNSGCSIVDSSNLTFGTGFNDAGGGVYATEWTSDFIKIWFFPRGSFPADIASSSPNPSENWGVPNSVFQGNFSLDNHFKDLQIIFDTTFCGQWAGSVWSSSSCASLAPTCEEYVTNNPKDFANAYWAINTLQVFQDDGQSENNGSSVGAAVNKRIDHKRRGGSVLPVLV